MAAAINLILLKFCFGDRKGTEHVQSWGEVSLDLRVTWRLTPLDLPQILAKEPGCRDPGLKLFILQICWPPPQKQKHCSLQA